MHWFDLDRFYAEVGRVLRPGGLLAAIAYDWFYVDPDIDEIVGRGILGPLQPHWAPNNRLIMEHYRTIPFPGEEVPLTPCAVHLAWTREQLEAYVLSWSAVQRLGKDVVAPAFAEMARIWPNEQARHVLMPMILRAARL
jgi:SAM-dependent methyltransferase